jgi:YVTN family beta-propeller protein
MILSRKAVYSSCALLFIVVFIAGCGDTFRPVAIPDFPPGPDPQQTKVAIVTSRPDVPVTDNRCTPTTPTEQRGCATHINLSGDTNIGQPTVGIGPVHAATYLNSTRVMVANQTENSLSHYAAFSPLSSVPSTISLPAGSAPSFLFTNQPNQAMFVILSGRDSVGSVSLATNALTAEVSFGSGAGPIAMTGTPNGNKLYVASANGTVAALNARDFTVAPTFIGVGSDPSAIVVSSDGRRVYVANRGSNSVSVIETEFDSLEETITVGTNPSALFFDPRLLRLYVVNSGSNSVSIIDANPDPNNSANFHKVIATPAVGASPSAVTALADGSRAYVANAGDGTVSVINTLGNTVLRTITVGRNPTRIVASADSTKVAVLNLDDNSVTTISTSNDAESRTLALPAGSKATSLLVAP